MSFIPQELIDEILSYVPSDDKQGRQSLRNCSLIAKSWINPSRRRLFETVQIRDTTFRRWLDTIPPANTAELLRHVRSLFYIVGNAARGSSQQPEGRVDILRDYLPSFHCLQHLSLFSTHIPSDISRQIEIFSAFRHSLSRLSLHYCTVTISALVALISCFPSLDRLDLRYITHEADGKPAPLLCRLLIRKLHISSFHDRGLDILNQLSELGLVFEELVVDGWSSEADSHTLSRIVDSLDLNVKRLRLLENYNTWGAYRSVIGSTLASRCRGLQELELSVRSPGAEEVYILSSIISASIQKVILTYWRSIRNPPWDNINWNIFDEPLCRLADQLGRTCELGVDFRIVGAGDEGAEAMIFPNSLVRFREKGLIRVVWVDPDEGERVVYPLPVGGSYTRRKGHSRSYNPNIGAQNCI